MFNAAGLQTRLLDDAGAAELDRLHDRCADFVRLVGGRDPAEGDGLVLLNDRPPGVAAEDKLVFGLFDGSELAGVVELLRGYPTPTIWCLGLLMLTPDRRGGGVGSAIYSALSDWIAAQGGKTIRLIVQAQNPAALRFWQRQAFKQVGTTLQETGHTRNTVLILEHDLRP